MHTSYRMARRIFALFVLCTALALSTAGLTSAKASQDENVPKINKIDILYNNQSVSSINAELGDPAIALQTEVKPKKASASPIEWTSSDTSVAIVDKEGKVIIFGKGDTTITAKAKDGSGKSDSIVIHVAANGSTYQSNDVLPDHNDGSKNSINDFIGVTHINPQYHFGSSDNVVEGGQRLLGLNTKSIKLYLSPNYKQFYQFTDWGTADYRSPAELAQSAPFQSLFNMNFNTYFLGNFVFSEQKYATYWINGFTAEQKQKEYEQAYDLAYYLLKAYEGTGKTFILQNWESDWSTMLEPNPATDPSDDVFRRITEWINIRQDAVNDARMAANSSNVHVYNALEVNLVKKAMNGGKTVTNDVIPNTYCDYYSYSSYDTIMEGSAVYGNALDYLKSKVAQNLNNGKSRVFVGEFGLPENAFGTKQVMDTVKMVVDVSRAKQIDHVVFWQLYDNECTVSPANSDQDCRGYWLIRPSGKKTAMWEYFYELLNNGATDPEYVPDPPSQYTSLEITLGAVNVEKGLKQIQAADGMTTVATIGGVESRVTPGANPNLYMYFATDHDYMTPNDAAVNIEVTYYDHGVSPLVLEYNSLTSIASSKQILRTNTDQWLTHTFSLSDARFTSGLSGVADFRFNDWNDPLYISKVKVSKQVAGAERNEISVILKASPIEDGISLKLLGYDGAALPAAIGGKEAIATDPNNMNNPDRANNNYLYFDADDEFVPPAQRELYINVTYFDSGTLPFELQYNSTLPNDAPNYLGLANPITVNRTDSGQWVTHTFHVADAEFANKLQGGLADFRLSDKGDKLYVSKIVIRKQPAQS